MELQPHPCASIWRVCIQDVEAHNKKLSSELKKCQKALAKAKRQLAAVPAPAPAPPPAAAAAPAPAPVSAHILCQSHAE